MSHLNKAKLLRQRLREQKAQKDKEEGKDTELNPAEEKEEPKETKPASKAPLKPSALKPSALKPSALKPSAIKKKESSPIKDEEEEEKEKEKKIDPLDFFKTEHKDEEPEEVNEELNELLNMIEGNDNQKEEETQKKEDSSDSDSNSSNSSDEDNKEQERLLNKQRAQAKLFANKNNRVSPVNNLFKPKRISEELTKEQIIEKFGADFDKAVELPELNEQKKQIMLKKMRKTINKMSSQRIQKHMDAELRHIIEEKIEDLKKIKGSNYNDIESKVQELILSLKQPDFYFADDEDVTQISDVQEKMDIKPRTDIDFEFFMKQTPKTN